MIFITYIIKNVNLAYALEYLTSTTTQLRHTLFSVRDTKPPYFWSWVDLALCGTWRYRRSWVIISTNSLVSPANVNILPVTSSSKSLLDTKHKIGPSTDPCGVPLNTDFQLETSLSTTTLCLLSVSHLSIQLIRVGHEEGLRVKRFCAIHEC